MSTRTVQADRDTCVGSGWCVNLAAGAFSLDATGKVVVEDPEAVRAEDLLEAEDSCPVSAISVELGFVPESE
ncbi:ferredoxin [Aeromicrobium sp. 50.2.37]|uniref:ferredoxin n=1 Tax=Aeromicrobium sp. 50.2.37 TaxID=2969305 RepID=UPI00215048F0|nr:ferredoxin [Aeromicrobium sp. 50.2.37]MCR4514111.1 ferredoxin [Aeromicrobium sp. 50.2.37]